MTETRQQIVDGIAYVIPRSEPDAFYVRKVGAFGVGITCRLTSWGVGFDILRAGLLVSVGPFFVWIAHIKGTLAIAAAARQGGDEVASPKPSQGAEQQQCRSGR